MIETCVAKEHLSDLDCALSDWRTQIAWKEIHPGHGKAYTEYLIIKKILEETTLHLLACRTVTRLQNAFRCSSAQIFYISTSNYDLGMRLLSAKLRPLTRHL